MAEKNDFSARLTDGEQLTIFRVDDKYFSYSNAVNLFNSIPFFFVQQPRTKKHVTKREFDFIDSNSRIQTTYRVKIAPGIHDYEILSGKNKGKEISIKRYPNSTDQIIMMFLIKLATEGQSFVDGGYVCVAFTLHQIYKELERYNKTRSFDEIRQSLEILSSSMCELSWEDREGNTRSCKSPIIFDLRKIKNNDVEIVYKAKRELYRVTLHPTVTKDIVDKSFRLINYDKHMSITGFLARWLHIRLSQYFIWANHLSPKPYNISMSNIYRNSCAPLYKDVFRNKIRVVEALEELSKIGVVDLSRLEIIPKRNPRSRKNAKPMDFIFNIYPQESFQNDQKLSNFQHNQISRRNHFTELTRQLQSN